LIKRWSSADQKRIGSGAFGVGLFGGDEGS
jgi:hypothetical protein